MVHRARARGLWQASSGTPEKQMVSHVLVTQGGLELERLGMGSMHKVQLASSMPETAACGSTTKDLNGYLSRLRNQGE